VKKYLAILLAVIFILSFSIVAYAMDTPEITLGGKIITKGWYIKNADPGNAFMPVDTDSEAFWHSNVNLTVDAKVDDNVRGMVEIETASGTSRNSGLWYWGNYDTKPDAELRIRQAWIQYTGSGLLGIPAGIKIGHMPIALGEKIFLNNERFGNDALLLWIDPVKELHLAAGATKLNEGDIYNHFDDLDGYVLIGTYMINKDNTLGVNYLWAHSDGNCPSTDGASDAAPVNNVDQLNFHNVGLHANGKIAGLSYAAEVDYQFGEIENHLFTGDDVTPKGWAVLAKLGYTLDPVTIRGAFAMGSGDSDAGDDDCEEFQTLLGPDYGPTARLVHYTQIYERTVRTASYSALLTTTEGGNVRNTGIANTTYVNLGVDVSPIKDISVSLDGYYLWATETGAWEDTVGNDVDSTVGWEVDAKLNYKLAKNLSYFVEAGYFDSGDFYHDAFGVDEEAVTQLIHGLALSF
jgi:hypothetical protein